MSTTGRCRPNPAVEHTEPGPRLGRERLIDDEIQCEPARGENPCAAWVSAVSSTWHEPLLLTTDQEVGDSSSSGRAAEVLAQQGFFSWLCSLWSLAMPIDSRSDSHPRLRRRSTRSNWRRAAMIPGHSSRALLTNSPHSVSSKRASHAAHIEARMSRCLRVGWTGLGGATPCWWAGSY